MEINKLKKVVVVSSGGDAPGLNAVIRAIVKAGKEQGIEVYGFVDGFKGAVENDLVRLDNNIITLGIIADGGTIIGTSNTANPFSYKVTNDDGSVEYKDLSSVVIENIKKEQIDCMFILGGDGSLKTARDFSALGINVIGIPKTIDNDVLKTDKTFGFDTAVSIATEALGRLETTAKAHSRIMVLEVMGRYAGWIALYAGIAGAADIILIPEIPYDINKVAKHILRRKEEDGKAFSLVIVSEGAKNINGDVVSNEREEKGKGIDNTVFGGVGEEVSNKLEELTGITSRATKLGYLQRGGSPVPSDRILSTTYGYEAMKLALSLDFGKMVSYTDGKFTNVPLEEVVGKNKKIGDTASVEKGSTKLVPEDHILIETGKKIGIFFGN